MAIDKKTLQRFLDNPAMFSAQDMGLEDGEALAPDESSLDGALDIPEVDPEGALLEQAPEISDPDEINQQLDLEQDEEGDDELASIEPMPKTPDSDAVTKLKRLKAGEPLEDTSTEQDQEIASDMQAPMDLRKKALQKIKQKYLGQ